LSPTPRISFGIIVFNGEPFTRYCLRALYPYAHEIIVVEGGHEGTAAVATPDGHSTDGTLQALEAFIDQEDPEEKVRLVTRDGFWPMTDELGRRRTAQSRAYAELAGGDYLWQVDIDEFYLPRDMQRIVALLARDPSITQVSFPFIDFWGRPGFKLGSSKLLRRNQAHRLFKWGPGYRYVTHQPPIVEDDLGRDLRTLRWVRPETTARMGIAMYHYSHLFPDQVRQKAQVYLGQEPQQFRDSLGWLQDSYLTLRRPYRVERHYYWPSWLERFEGPQPPEIQRLMTDVARGRVHAELRPMQDAERLLRTAWYPLGARALRAAEPFRQAWRFGAPPVVNVLHGRMPRTVRRLATKTPARPAPAPARRPARVTAPTSGDPDAVAVLILAPLLDFPNGMAAASRIELLATALNESGCATEVVSVLAAGRADRAANLVSAGYSLRGVRFAYLARSPVKSAFFLGRRADELGAWTLAMLRLARLGRRRGRAVVYLYATVMRWTWSRAALIAAARLLRVPVVTELNERPWPLAQRTRSIERLVSPLAGLAGAVCISGFLQTWAHNEARDRSLGVQTLLVPILTDVDEQPAEPYPQGGRPRLVFAASADYRSSLEFILEAMAIVWAEHPACTLSVTGLDPDTGRGAWLGQRRHDGTLDPRVETHGILPRPELLALYGRAHGLLAPLFHDVRSEARFPTKIGEYLASGRPVVTTAVGEMARYFVDGETAYLSAPDPHEYGKAITRLLDDPGRAAAVGRQGRELCRARFDYRMHGAALAGFLGRIAAGRRGASAEDGRDE
jgi:glycosyltransferase involved in cell wall biosynthesis